MQADIKKDCVHFIIALAWRDGEMAEVERDFLRGLIERTGLDSATRETLEGWLDAPPPSPDWSSLEQNPELAHDVLLQAMVLAAMDMSVTTQEMAYLHRFREALGMDEMTFYRMQQEAEQVIATLLSSD